jgi:hypothetical protein
MFDPDEGFRAYKIYIALKLHFTTSFDYIKYNGKTRVTKDSFYKRRDKFKFASIEKKHPNEIEEFIIANFVNGTQSWNDIFSMDSEEIFMEWKKCQQSLLYIFKNDIKKLVIYCEEKKLELDDIFKVGSNHPKLLQLYYQKRIKIETIVLLSCIFPFLTTWKKQMNDELGLNFIILLEKYRVFFNIEKQKYISAIKEIIND